MIMTTANGVIEQQNAESHDAEKNISAEPRSDDKGRDGERLEAKGVMPTIEVPLDIPYAAGADPQLDKAVAVLSDASRG